MNTFRVGFLMLMKPNSIDFYIHKNGTYAIKSIFAYRRRENSTDQ